MKITFAQGDLNRLVEYDPLSACLIATAQTPDELFGMILGKIAVELKTLDQWTNELFSDFRDANGVYDLNEIRDRIGRNLNFLELNRATELPEIDTLALFRIIWHNSKFVQHTFEFPIDRDLHGKRAYVLLTKLAWEHLKQREAVQMLGMLEWQWMTHHDRLFVRNPFGCCLLATAQNQEEVISAIEYSWSHPFESTSYLRKKHFHHLSWEDKQEWLIENLEEYRKNFTFQLEDIKQASDSIIAVVFESLRTEALALPDNLSSHHKRAYIYLLSKLADGILKEFYARSDDDDIPF